MTINYIIFIMQLSTKYHSDTNYLAQAIFTLLKRVSDLLAQKRLADKINNPSFEINYLSVNFRKTNNLLFVNFFK